jgi:23S rRNA (cytosine1962-C5)-methyltransferase
MIQYPKVILKPAKDAPVRRNHPWLFSGAVRRSEGNPAEGDIVEVFSAEDEYLGTGHYADGSIMVKIFTFTRADVGYNFWKEKVQNAYRLREKIGLTTGTMTNAYRLAFSEGDGLPGLIIDYYNGVCVIQAQSAGMHRIKPDIVNILRELYGENLRAVYDKSGEPTDGYLFGTPGRGMITETGHQFVVDWEKGQKTGFFLDQRLNRLFAQFYAKDKKVLNAFSYSGAFSVYALKGGASAVHSVDTSRQALELADENIVLNGIGADKHLSIVADVKKYLAETAEKYDMIIIDPPAFAKTHNVSHNALQAYRYINSLAVQKLQPGGILMTFSCSQAINREMFRSAVMAAAFGSKREVRILHHLSQGPDHPVNLYHPEGEYLKGMILSLD